MTENNTSIVALPGSVYATRTGLTFTDGITYDDWRQIGGKLSNIEGAVHWWIGDWLNYGEGKWGEKYSQAIDETDFEYQTVANDKYISSHIDFSRRREKLNWSIHAEVASLPPDDQVDLLDQAESKEWTRKEMREQVRQRKHLNLLEERSRGGLLPEGISLIQGDFREIMANMPSNSVDMIFTDPPYGKEYIYLYKDLAEQGARVLKPGGSLITYFGQYALPDITQILSEYLRFWWILCVKHAGGSARMLGIDVFVEWKPLLWYVKDHKRHDAQWVSDLIDSSVPTKEEHEWQQSYREADYYIDKLTLPGDVILDPFAGSGTTLISAFRLKRQAIGIELDNDRANMARTRIQAET